MYRYIAAASLSSMFDDFDLEDFGEVVESRLNRKFNQKDIKITKVTINNSGQEEWLNIDVDVDGQLYKADIKLSGVYLRKPRDLIAKYADRVMYNIAEQLSEAGIFVDVEESEEF